MANLTRPTRDRNLNGFRGNGPLSAGILGARGECCAGHLSTAFSTGKPGWNARGSLEKRRCRYFGRFGCGIDHICPMGTGPELKIEGARRYLDVKIFFDSIPHIHEGDSTWLALARFQ
jgi:hypothetical protein